jgi:hypothetical protein
MGWAKMLSLIFAFQCAERRFVFHALGDLAVVINAPDGVVIADLGHGSHVQGVVELPVPASEEPLNVVVARGHVDGCGPVVGGEPVSGREAVNVADLAEHSRGDDRADAVDVGDAGLGRGDDAGDPALRCAALLGDGAQLIEQFGGPARAGRRRWRRAV